MDSPNSSSAPEDTDAPAADATFGRLLAEYASWLRSAVRRFCPRDMGIQLEDVEQEVAIRLWRAIRDERPIEHPSAYIYRAAATATIDAMRRVRTRREASLRLVASNDDESTPDANGFEAKHPSPERAAEHNQILELVQVALDALPADRRRAVGLYLQGFSTREIADIMDWTEAKSRNLVHRTLKTMREELRHAGIDYAHE